MAWSLPAKPETVGCWLVQQLAPGPVAAVEIKDRGDAAGYGGSTLGRAANELGVERRREGFGPGSKVFWRLPLETTAPNAQEKAASRQRRDAAGSSNATGLGSLGLFFCDNCGGEVSDGSGALLRFHFQDGRPDRMAQLCVRCAERMPGRPV